MYLHVHVHVHVHCVCLHVHIRITCSGETLDRCPHTVAYRSSVRWLFLPLTVDGLGAAADVSQRDALEGAKLLANLGNQITRVATRNVTTTTACIVITAASHNVNYGICVRHMIFKQHTYLLINENSAIFESVHDALTTHSFRAGILSLSLDTRRA